MPDWSSWRVFCAHPWRLRSQPSHLSEGCRTFDRPKMHESSRETRRHVETGLNCDTGRPQQQLRVQQDAGVGGVPSEARRRNLPGARGRRRVGAPR